MGGGGASGAWSFPPDASPLGDRAPGPCAEGPQGVEEDAGAARRARRYRREGDPVGGLAKRPSLVTRRRRERSCLCPFARPVSQAAGAAGGGAGADLGGEARAPSPAFRRLSACNRAPGGQLRRATPSGRTAAGTRPSSCPLRRKVPSGRMMAAGLGSAQKSLSDSKGKGAKHPRMAAGAFRLRRSRDRSRRVPSWRPGRRARRAAAAPSSRIKHTFRPRARSARVLPDLCVWGGGPRGGGGRSHLSVAIELACAAKRWAGRVS